MSITTRVAEKTGVIGIVVGSFGCAACFPATASIGTAVGLGFLGAWEGLFVRILIPIFALVALFANLTGWFSHHAWYRALAGSIGPVMVLVGAFGLMGVFGLTRGFLAVNVARGMFYAGLIVMVFAALSDLVRPANRHCRTDDAKTPGERN